MAKEIQGRGRIHCPEEEGKSARRVKKFCGKSSWFCVGKGEKQGSTAKNTQDGHRSKKNGDGATKPGAGLVERSKREIRVAAPMFVPATEDGRLIRKLKDVHDMLGDLVRWKFQIVSRGGRSLRELLTRSNIYSKDHCGRDCKACDHQKKPLDCRRRGLVYETACLDCRDAEGETRARYIGEKARSGSERFGEHREDAEKEKKDSHIYKHWSVHHGGVR